MPDIQPFTDAAPLLQELPSAYPVGLLTQPPWYDFTKQNGYIKLASRLHLKVETDIDVIESLWEEFSPKSSLFDLWDVRRAFHDGYGLPPYAVTLFEKHRGKTQVVGFLPLCIDDEGDEPGEILPNGVQYKWFGTNWPEDNTFFVKDPEIIPLLLFVAPSPLKIDCIRPQPELAFLNTLPGFSINTDKKYFLDLARIKTVDDFLALMKKKRRYNIKRDRKRILSLQPTVRINQWSDIESMFALNIERFRQKFPDQPQERSTFESDLQKQVFRNLLRVKSARQVRLITTIIDNDVVAVEMGLVYNGTYYALNAGAAIAKYSGIGSYSSLLVIEDALRLGCKKIDFLEGANNWKDHWHLESYYQYRFEK